MKLDVGHDAVVHLVGGNFQSGATGVLARAVGELEGVHLEVAEGDRVGIVCLEWRASVGACTREERNQGRGERGTEAR